MFPVLFDIAGVPVRSYAVAVAVGFAVAYGVRRAEVARLGYQRTPGHQWVGLGALVGAVVGAKLGMVLFGADLRELLAGALGLDFTGKTVVGGIAGGYAGVEVTKRLVGVRHSTGDAFAVALPLAQALGRVGCFLEGCCAGNPWQGPWAVSLAGVQRHPAQLYEAALDLALAGVLWALRRRTPVPGELFRLWLVGYATIRFVLEPLRADAVLWWGPLSAVQWVCLATIVAFSVAIVRARRSLRPVSGVR